MIFSATAALRHSHPLILPISLPSHTSISPKEIKSFKVFEDFIPQTSSTKVSSTHSQ
jgi:hypothetical protein